MQRIKNHPRMALLAGGLLIILACAVAGVMMLMQPLAQVKAYDTDWSEGINAFLRVEVMDWDYGVPSRLRCYAGGGSPTVWRETYTPNPGTTAIADYYALGNPGEIIIFGTVSGCKIGVITDEPYTYGPPPRTGNTD